jgi:hypothetical protein
VPLLQYMPFFLSDSENMRRTEYAGQPHERLLQIPFTI